MRQVFLTILVCVSCVLALPLAAAPPDAAARIGPEAVWNPPAGFNEKFRAACAKLEGAKFSDCFVEQMAKAGASPQAVAFAKRVDGMGFARAFHDEGAVDIVWAEYPYRANSNRVCLLVNGDPAIVDVDDLSKFDRNDLKRFPIWKTVLGRHPKAEIFPADRENTQMPIAHHVAGGETRFLVGYEIHDGCRACALIGTLRVFWNFDASGKFLGTQVKAVRRGKG
jgi:hypothetical protein